MLYLCLRTVEHLFDGKNDNLQCTITPQSQRLIRKYGFWTIDCYLHARKIYDTSEYKRKIIPRLLNWWQEFLIIWSFHEFWKYLSGLLGCVDLFPMRAEEWLKHKLDLVFRLWSIYIIPHLYGVLDAILKYLLIVTFHEFFTFIWSKWIHRIKIWFFSVRENLSILFQ